MPRILLIDDDQDLAPPLREYFARFDLDLSAAHHPQEGLRKLREEAPDLVILDLMLPDMDGFDVCRTIRRDSEVPVIMLTARGEVTDPGVFPLELLGHRGDVYDHVVLELSARGVNLTEKLEA